jgi:hypothetical protein
LTTLPLFLKQTVLIKPETIVFQAANKNNQNNLPHFFIIFPTFSVNKGTQGIDNVLLFCYIL